MNIEPVARAERLAVLDVLRGFALLGILLANVHYFSGWEFTEMMGTATPTAADHVVLWLTHLFITAKFYSVFSLLFGIGFFVFLQRAESKGIAAVPLFRRRLRWLLAIGLLHSFFLWAGDILTVYALLGFLLVPFRHSTDRALLRWAAVLLALPVAAYALMWAAGMGDPLAAPTGAAPDAGGFDPIAFMLAGFAGGYRDVLVANALNLAGRWVDLVITLRFPKVLAMFLIGFYVGRAGLARDLSAHAGLFRRVLIAGLLVGLPANIYLAWAADHVPYLPASAAGFLSALAGAVGVPSLALAYAAGIALLARLASAGRALRVLAPVGRMALTNYLLQSLACAFIFYGYGLGLVGRTGPASAALTAVTIYAVQVLLSGLWLRHYAYGPMEWMWRRLTYRIRVPMRRPISAATISIVAALLVVPLAVGCTADVTVSPRSHTQGGPSGGPDADLAITNVTVIDVADGAVRPDQTVLVSGNRIAAVGPAGSTRPAGGARVVDARGKYLIPGLWDMHVHAARAERAPRFWPLLIAHGVTGIREMGSFMDSLLHWRTESRRPGALAPRIAWSAATIEWTGSVMPPEGDAVALPDAEAARTGVDALKRLDFDFIKVGSHGIAREAYFALLARAQQAGIPVIGHVPTSVTAVEASDAGQRSFEHPTDLLMACIPGAPELAVAHLRAVTDHGGASQAARAAEERLAGALALSEPDVTLCGALLDRMATNRTWFTPTLTLYRGETQPSSFDGDPRLRWIPDALAERWRQGRRLTPELEKRFGKRIMDNALRTVSLAHRAGVGILAGTDTGDNAYTFAGPSLHDELSMLVDAGLSPLEALQAATLNPARFLGRTDDLGAVQQGKLADLVLLDANPLEDIRHTRGITGVVLNGRYLDRQSLDALLARAEAEARRAWDGVEHYADPTKRRLGGFGRR